MLKFPEVPSDLSAVDDAALEALRAELHRKLSVVASGDYEPEAGDIGLVGAATAGHESVKAEIAKREAASANAQAVLAAAAASVAVADPEDDEDTDGDGDVDEDDVTEADDEVDTGAATHVDEVEPDTEIEAEVDAESAESLAVASTANGRRTPQKGVGAKTRPLSGAPKGAVTAYDGVPGKKAGESFDSWKDVSFALQERGRSVGASKDLVPVAGVKANYAKDRVLLDTASTNTWNLSRFEPDEIQAALCAPCTPYYNLSCQNTDRRPVFNSLPQFQAPRGCVSIYPSPSLSDITTGYGLWDKDDDADSNATKAACQTIACATPTEYFFYGVYRCITIKNMLQMTFPELVEAYLNRLAAATARMAEKQLLDLMGSAVNHITAPSRVYGAYETLASTLLMYITGYQERQRWDFDSIDMWAPRWLANALRMDMFLHRNTNGGRKTVPSLSEVNGMLANVGVNPHWFIDTPSWGIAAPTQGTGASNLITWPDSVSVLLAPPGKFALIDRGELRIGVTGNNIYRDNTSNSRNEFTMFFETFEGIVDTDSCPADMLNVPLCYNGAQVADVDADCDGRDLLST